MAIIVEDGTGLSNSETYISVTDADTYHSNRGNTAWASLTNAAKEQALRKAADYMIQVYRQSWIGTRYITTQALDWPRSNVPSTEDGVDYVLNTVPNEVKVACAELALKASSSDLAPDIDRVTKSEKLGPMAVEYETGVPYKRYRAIDNMLSAWLLNVGGMFRKLERV